MTIRDKGIIYFVVIDLVNGLKEFETRDEALAYYQRPLMDSPERILCKVEVQKKKNRVYTESEL